MQHRTGTIMKRLYKFDNNNLVFSKQDSSLKQKIKDALKYVYAGTALGLALWIVSFSGILKSPEELLFQKKNKTLLSKVEQINIKFDSISTNLQQYEHKDDNLYRVIAFKSPLSSTIRQAGFGGVNKYHNLESFSNGDLLINLSLKSDILLKQLQIQEKSYDTLYYLAEVKQDSLLSVPGIIPISPSGYYRISDPFGWRMHPIYHRLIKHTGIDFAGPIGSPIYAPGNGKVENIRITKTGYGKRLVINHGYGFKTLYGHLSKIYVKEGDVVKRGQIIAEIGNSGTSTGPHLHYEVIHNNNKINPKSYFLNDLSNDEYMQMVHVLAK